MIRIRYQMYAQFEERYGLAKESLKILHRGVSKVEKSERVRMWEEIIIIKFWS